MPEHAHLLWLLSGLLAAVIIWWRQGRDMGPQQLAAVFLFGPVALVLALIPGVYRPLPNPEEADDA